MKKQKAKILLAILASICFGNESNGEIITIVTTEAKNFESAPIEVKENQVLKVLHIRKSNNAATRLYVKIQDTTFEYIVPQTPSNKSYMGNIKPGENFVYDYRDGGAVTSAAVPLFSTLIFQGPLTFSISSSNKPSLVTVEVTNNDYGAGNGNNVTVIPETADESTLVLEGSDDMVNWTTETLGDKPKANRKKFYRLRAKKK